MNLPQFQRLTFQQPSLKFHLSQASGRNLFTGYGTGYVAINGARHASHLLVTPDRVLPWDIAGFDALNAAQATQLMALAPEIVILGTGTTLRFPPAEVTRTLTASGIGLEVMDSNAACRTYNVLMAEGRSVLAAILMD
ncbi:MAG TPA: Mth938-like domain-containing protein [Burkholderiales bacterium]|nr:Mth938-like domain-containing protein [Burkholderiales bacterium]